MNTPAHLIFGLAAFGKVDAPKVTVAALAGAMIPDLSLYFLSGWHLFVMGTDPSIVFGQLYYSDQWQSIFRVDNSIILWAIGLGLAIAMRTAWAFALCAAALLHLGLDLLVHVDDGRAHFWPISNWIFESPISFWDPDHHGGLDGGMEMVVSMVICVALWRRYTTRAMRIVIAALAMCETLPGVMWAIMFAGT